MNKKILMLSNFSSHNKRVVDLTLKNHYEYCSKWNINFIFTISEYSPQNNIEQLICFLNLYDTVITIGTDILFTNFEKDIRDFIDYDYPIIMQQERKNDNMLNGDFIIWNKTARDKFYFIYENKNKFYSSQQLLSFFAKELNIKILPPKQIQSVSPYGSDDKNQTWSVGDFSVHCHRPGVAPIVDMKTNDLSKFIKSNGNLINFKF